MNILDEYLNTLQEFEPVTLAAAGVVLGAANLIMMATRTYKDYFTKAARQCTGLPPHERSICILKAKYYATNVQLQTLKGSMSKCTKAKSMEKCKMKMFKKIKEVQTHMKGLVNRMKQLEKKG